MFYRITLKAGYYSGTYEKFDTQEDADVSASGDTTVSELPPYADQTKACACTYDVATEKWTYDDAKYLQLLQEESAKASIPTLEELFYMHQDTQVMVDQIVESIIPDLVEGLESSMLKGALESIYSKLYGTAPTEGGE